MYRGQMVSQEAIRGRHAAALLLSHLFVLCLLYSSSRLSMLCQIDIFLHNSGLGRLARRNTFLELQERSASVKKLRGQFLPRYPSRRTFGLLSLAIESIPKLG